MKYVIASFPRSGNHWVRYIVEYCTKMRTMGEGDKEHREAKDKPIFEYIDPSFYEKDGFFAIKRHNIRSSDKNLNLIFIIRNYKEVFIRHNRKAFHGKPRINKELNKMINNYIDLIQNYDIWNANKILISYEDLISNNETIRSIMAFIGYNDKFDGFISNLDEHRHKCLSICSHHTNGDKKIYYSNKVDPLWIMLLSNHFFENYPKLFNKYLREY